MTLRQKLRVPAVEGWFTLDDDAPALLGHRCTVCGTVHFPGRPVLCRNPVCDSVDFGEAPLSRRGRIWSYTDARYAPPPPFVAAEPYRPFALAAVELVAEQMVVLGQVSTGYGAGDLAIGDEVELVIETLHEDEENTYLVWKWKPLRDAVAR